jgi:hypothetical protein
MPTCETCGNDYDKAFTVIMADKPHIFDSFECAIAKLAPVCAHCDCRIIGHGVEVQDQIYCCANCANHGGRGQVRDRA